MLLLHSEYITECRLCQYLVCLFRHKPNILAVCPREPDYRHVWITVGDRCEITQHMLAGRTMPCDPQRRFSVSLNRSPDWADLEFSKFTPLESILLKSFAYSRIQPVQSSLGLSYAETGIGRGVPRTHHIA